MLKVILISLIILTVFVIGAVGALGVIISCYATDPDYWNRNIEPLLKDIREGVDAGNKLINYPPERFKNFM